MSCTAAPAPAGALALTLGDTQVVRIDYTGADGSALTLPAGSSAMWTMGRPQQDGTRGPALVTKASPASLAIAGDGTATWFLFTLQGGDTAALAPGAYWFQLVVLNATGGFDGGLDGVVLLSAVPTPGLGGGLFPDSTAQVKSAFAATQDNPRILPDGTASDDGSPTLLRMVNQIADELDRPDLLGPIRNAIRGAIGFWQRERFAFNDGVLAFVTAAGQAGYGGRTLAGQPIMLAIDSAIALDGCGRSWPLRNVPLADLESMGDQAQTGQPTCYAKFSGGYRLYPVPDGLYTVRFTGHVQLGAPATDADGNAWTDQAYDLIASYAKRYLAIHRLKDAALKAAMDVAVGEASTSLKGLATTVASTGVVAAYDL